MAQKLCAEVFVIGGGPAGLSAALALCRQRYRTIVFDSGVYRNSVAHHMHMVPTWDHKDPKEFRAAARKEILDRYDTTLFVDQRVDKLEKREDGTFEATCNNGRTYTASKVILATGITDVFPEIKGFAEAWGSSIFHCLFCHGYEESGGEHAGILAEGFGANKKMAVGIACTAKRLAKKITIYTNGNSSLTEELRDLVKEHDLGLEDRKISELKKVSGTLADIDVCFEDGTSQRNSFLQNLPNGIPNGPFAEQLGLQVEPMGDYKTGAPFPETNVPGVFAAGDAGAMVKSVAGAISSGGMCVAGVAHSLAT